MSEREREKDKTEHLGMLSKRPRDSTQETGLINI